ncbi:NAD(P)-binding domain-containing protein [Mycolicibacterium rufum]|uniref:NAD(P)-binding domain-containing protein n=1 Tax=Mycolicibacterium rufum TaxID=318424 RepID=A0A9X2YBJ0_9MYCO|nr:NAD(P)-binding domain-containing protein [Mycolicibacterium rufum]MCV7070867.1 NAD(P)-binding domain-containing protein [Mycolicibacterium rufum]ULP37725.1 NAD(P)-binding domain-containing protein [Mycolicibacterium rufum]
MRYAIIGSGNIGSAVAGHFARTGLDVAVAASRGPEAVAPLAQRLGAHVLPAEVSDALQADVVVLAVPFDAVRDLVGQVPDWSGRIIVDATNAIDPQTFSAADLGGRASSDLVAEWAAGARVVKAFGHTWARVLAREPGDGRGGRRMLFVSGNHPDANAAVAALIEQFGFEPIDLGRNDTGGLLQQFGGPLTTRSLISQPIGGASPAEMDLV